MNTGAQRENPASLMFFFLHPLYFVLPGTLRTSGVFSLDTMPLIREWGDVMQTMSIDSKKLEQQVPSHFTALDGIKIQPIWAQGRF